MTQKLNQLVFFGTEDFSATVLDNLLSVNVPIEAVITKPDAKKGRGQKFSAPSVKTLALKHNMPVFQPSTIDEMRQAIAQTSCFGAILVSFGKIIPRDIIDSFQIGIINLHPSLLPKYRGPSPIETAILDDVKETGVSLMALNAKMDAGGIYAQTKLNLSPNITASQLYQLSAQLGSQLLIQTLPQITHRTLIPVPQDESKATYCSLLTKSQGWLQPALYTAHQLEAQIRAYQIFPRSRFTFYGQTCIIIHATVNTQSSILSLKCADGKFLNVDKLIAPSGKIMSDIAFANGYRTENN